MAALCKPKVGFSEEELKTFPLTEQQLLEAYLAEGGTEAGAKNGAGAGAKKKLPGAKPSGDALERFCIDVTERAREGNIDNIVGRNREIRKVAEILGRRTKPNVIIVGEPGVGKTALVEGFCPPDRRRGGAGPFARGRRTGVGHRGTNCRGRLQGGDRRSG